MAKARAVGADAVHLFAKETTYAVAPAGDYTRLPMRSYGLGADQPLEDDPLWNRSSPDASDPSQGALSVTGDMVAPLDVRGGGMLLAMVFGAPVTTNASGTYTHVFKSGKDLFSYTHQVGHPKLTVPNWRSAKGVKAGGLQFPMSRTGRLLATIPLVAQSEGKDSSGSRDATPLVYPYLPFNNASGSIGVDGDPLAGVSAAQFNYSTGLETADAIRPDMMVDGVDEGLRTLGGSATARLSSDTTLDDLADNNVPAPMRIKFLIPSQPAWSLEFFMPRVFFARSRKPIDGPGGISAPVNWIAAYDDIAGFMVSATLVNDVVSY